jgi:hypothetical protein
MRFAYRSHQINERGLKPIDILIVPGNPSAGNMASAAAVRPQ